MATPPLFQITALSEPGNELSHRLVWLAARSDGSPAGSAFLRIHTQPGKDHLASLDVAVHPAERRQGAGSLLLATAVAAARQEQRRCIVAEPEAGSPGDRFLQAQGWRKVLTLTYARLSLAEIDHRAISAIADRPHPGYRLTSWDGVVAAELAESFAVARHAMNDMPLDDMDYGQVLWDADQVVAVARAVADRGEHLHTVAAIDEKDGSVAGFTETVVPGDGRGDGQNYSTAVLHQHRGHGLGRWMKAEAIRQVRERYPSLGGLMTDTADSNVHMRTINDSLGYEPTHATVEYQLDLEGTASSVQPAVSP